MTYWHIQIHPNDINWNREEELLKKFSIIGMGDDWEESESSINDFIRNMDINDIVLVRRGNSPIALVQVVGDVEDIGRNEFDRVDWFRYRRTVKVLEWSSQTLGKFPQPRGALQRLINQKTKSYKYVESWHKKISPSFYKNSKGLKLQNIYIQNYKIFKDFKISFNDKITVLAGINGSGKTTILEFIKKFTTYIEDKDKDKSLIEISINKEPQKISYLNIYATVLNIDGNLISKEETSSAKYYNKHIYYFPTGTDITDIKEEILNYIKYTLHKEDLKLSDVFSRVGEYIDTIFKDLNIQIKFNKTNEKEDIFFSNNRDESFLIDELSTGEKTLLSKVLYLYLKDIKDSVILIDEPELSLHPTWQNKILKLYEKFSDANNCQIIIATHSPHIIGSAKNEYLRILKFDDNNQIGVINDVLAYGRDIKWVLEEVMGANYTREKAILDKFNEIQRFINDNRFDKAEKELDLLEKVIGENDSDILKLRNDLAFERMELEED